MTTVRQYAGVYRGWQRFVCDYLGTNLNNSSVKDKAIAGSTCVLLGVLTKALVDAGVITDQQVQDAAQTVFSDPGWTQEP